MTDPKLREARIAEAKRRAHQNLLAEPVMSYTERVAHHLMDLIESDWRPEPEVDAVTLAAREWMKGATVIPNGLIDMGQVDESVSRRAFRAGHAHALANCADVKRMDWLGGQWVEVVDVAGRCLRHGIFVREPDALRTKIDRAMGGGE